MRASSANPEKRSCPCRVFGGFTILELLVAFVMFSVLSVLLLGAISQIAHISQESEAQKNRREIGRALLDLMARDLQGAIPPLPGFGTNAVNFELTYGLIGESTSHALFWQCALPSSRDKSDVATVGYFVRTNGLFRLYTNAPTSDLASEVGNTNGMTSLADGVLRMGITAFNKDGSTASSSTTYATNLPASVEISLAVADPRTLKQKPALTVPDFNNPPKGVQVFRTRIDLPTSP